jgi:hypothetical protein
MIRVPDPRLGLASAAIVSIGMVVSGLEQLAEHRQFSRKGIYSWQLLRTLHSWTIQGQIGRVLDAVFEYPQVVWIFALQVVFGGAAFVAAIEAAYTHTQRTGMLGILVGGMLVVQLLGTLRCQIGLDGADQMRTIVLAGVLIFVTAPAPLVQMAVLWFIAAQSLCAYITSGIAKAVSATWRSGSAVAAILNARSYGDRRLSSFLMRRRWASVAASRGTIVFECSAPLFVFGGYGPCRVFVGLAVVFHIMIAAAMGLNDFFWSFCSALPSLLYVSQVVH